MYCATRKPILTRVTQKGATPYSVTHYQPPAPPPRRPRPPGVPIVGSSVLFLRPRDGGVQPSIDGPF